jgi:hypothetical protein
MKNEMDIMKMDAPRRYAWLRANRVTLMIVGIVWLGMIVRQWANGENAWFLILMVPVFALTRLAAYLYIKRSRHTTAAQIISGEPPSHGNGRHRTAPGRSEQSGEMAQCHPPDASGSSFSLLLP